MSAALDRWRALASVRTAVRGWAFAPADWLPGMIARAEAARDELPEELRAEADAIVAPLRRVQP